MSPNGFYRLCKAQIVFTILQFTTRKVAFAAFSGMSSEIMLEEDGKKKEKEEH